MKKSSLLLLSSVMSLLSATVAFSGQELPSTHPKIDLPAQSATHQQSTTISGKVLETMNSGGYSYINLQKQNGEKVWIAVKEARVSVGDQMSFMEGLVMTKFESKSLKRTFDTIIFSNGVISQTKVSAAPPSEKAPVSQLGSKSAVTPKEKMVSVKKVTGPNAYTVEGIYRNSAKLNKKQVLVRGKVVKVTPRIMKRTWIHIQDGTGSQAKGTHNLVVTTTADAEVGDVVIVKGTLARDRDFGAGYFYKVIVEDATITK